MRRVQNYIFDLGGVIINLNLNKTFEGFAAYSGLPLKTIYEKMHFTDFWKAHETGHISDSIFRDEIRRFLGTSITDQTIDQIWNALLLDIPLERIEIIKLLSKKHRIFLLSNTNEIHYKRFTEILNKTSGITSFEHLFEKTYYSHRMGLRKPDPKIYRQVLDKNRLNASETCFIDDNFDNIVAAQKLGMQTIHINSEKTIADYFINE